MLAVERLTQKTYYAQTNEQLVRDKKGVVAWSLHCGFKNMGLFCAPINI